MNFTVSIISAKHIVLTFLAWRKFVCPPWKRLPILEEVTSIIVFCHSCTHIGLGGHQHFREPCHKKQFLSRQSFGSAKTGRRCLCSYFFPRSHRHTVALLWWKSISDRRPVLDPFFGYSDFWSCVVLFTPNQDEYHRMGDVGK